MINKLRKAGNLVAILAALTLGGGCGDSGSSSKPNPANVKPVIESVEVRSDTNLETIAYDSFPATATFNVHDADGDVVSGEYRINGGAWQALSGPINGPYTGAFTVSGDNYTIEARVLDNDSEEGTYSANPDIAAKETRGKSAVRSKIEEWVNSGAVIDGDCDTEVTHADGSMDRVDGWVIDQNGVLKVIEYQGEYQTTQTLNNMEARFTADGSKTVSVYSESAPSLDVYLNSLNPDTMGN